MDLREIIAALEAEDSAKVLPLGFTNPHSSRAYYEQLAFEPAVNVTVGAMLADARSAIGETYHGYKGGEFTMKEYTDCWLAEYGACGEEIGPNLLRLMLAAGSVPGPAAEPTARPEPMTDPFEPYELDERAAAAWTRALDAGAQFTDPTQIEFTLDAFAAWWEAEVSRALTAGEVPAAPVADEQGERLADAYNLGIKATALREFADQIDGDLPSTRMLWPRVIATMAREKAEDLDAQAETLATTDAEQAGDDQ